MSTVPPETRRDESSSGPLPGISFVVTVYNKRPFLPQMIAGLAAQQGDFVREFIFVDDGSSDGSLDELKRLTAGWRDVRILTQPNRGPSIATNRGIEAARYPYIKLVDADDVLLPWSCLHLLRALRDNPGAVLAWGPVENYDAREAALERLSHAVEPASEGGRLNLDPVRTTLSEHFAIGPTKTLILAETARAVGGCDPQVFVQDYSLALRLATAGAFVVLQETVALRPASASGRVNDDSPQVLHDANLAIANFLTEYKVPQDIAARAVRRAADRAYLWARRREGAGPLSRWSRLRLRARLPHPSPALVRESCEAFTLSRSVRRSDV